ncbi:tetratricopeptide repeat-containing response regulator [Colwellia hornerae]|uniref:Response regulator n=1 Tax=Colwellia hornerae TaxID=89402 RepID=A0A5C6Q3M5_9GAMM|nr:tetratricopeptide repeat-containing response regulator [Colwellia hornerae]TWX47427.1 response regulator [Colwellia hornerae]TWX54707.1 response regulator [Colwellia hornerae]TWX63420.1 response regulator [Colwellia hornerae]
MNKIEYSKMRFLIVENIVQSRDALKLFAYTLGALRVDTSNHASDVLTLCESIQFDVILLGYDLGEDKKNGQHILEELRSKKLISRHCTIIMITAEVSQAMVLAALEHKPDEYLAKPYTLNDLCIRLERCFAKKTAMLDIYNAMDNEDSQEVISLCQNIIKVNSIYKNECLGIQSRQYFVLEKFDKAREIYDAYACSPNCQWAAIGLGKIALVEHNYDLAIDCFNAVIEYNPLYLTAYDWLANSYQLNKQPLLAEDILERALVISPLSVTRLEKYADLCLTNENFDKATLAFAKTTALAFHSVHKKPDNTLHFVEALLESMADLEPQKSRRLSNKAFKLLTDMVRDFNSIEIKIHSKLLAARLHDKIKDPRLAKETLKEAELLLRNCKHEISPVGTIAIAKSLIALGKKSYANNLLTELAHVNPDNSSILLQISEITDKPNSDQYRAAAQNALELGVNLYKKQQYSLAIDKLNKALVHFPNHTGIKLNLLQVLLVSFEKDNQRVGDLVQAEVLIKALTLIESTSEFYTRFKKLNDKYSDMMKIS